MKADYKKLQAVLNQLNQTKETETHRQAKHIAMLESNIQELNRQL